MRIDEIAQRPLPLYIDQAVAVVLRRRHAVDERIDTLLHGEIERDLRPAIMGIPFSLRLGR